MKKKKEKLTPLQKQFKAWSKKLMDVNPGYVRDVKRLRSYLKSPNWDDPEVEYAHYREFVAYCYPELLPVFERLRESDGDEGLDEYRGLLRDAGIKEEE